MSTNKIRLAILVVAVAVVGGTAASVLAGVSARPRPNVPVAAAASPAIQPSTAPKREVGEWCATYRAAFAARLGVSEAELLAAARDAAQTTVAKAVSAGALTAAEAERITHRLKATATDGRCHALAGGKAIHPASFGRAHKLLETAAKALGMEPAALHRELRHGTRLTEIAGQRGVDYETLTAEVLGSLKSDLDAAVDSAAMTRERADAILERVSRALADGRLGGTKRVRP